MGVIFVVMAGLLFWYIRKKMQKLSDEGKLTEVSFRVTEGVSTIARGGIMNCGACTTAFSGKKIRNKLKVCYRVPKSTSEPKQPNPSSIRFVFNVRVTLRSPRFLLLFFSLPGEPMAAFHSAFTHIHKHDIKVPARHLTASLPRPPPSHQRARFCAGHQVSRSMPRDHGQPELHEPRDFQVHPICVLV